MSPPFWRPLGWILAVLAAASGWWALQLRPGSERGGTAPPMFDAVGSALSLFIYDHGGALTQRLAAASARHESATKRLWLEEVAFIGTRAPEVTLAGSAHEAIFEPKPEERLTLRGAVIVVRSQPQKPPAVLRTPTLLLWPEAGRAEAPEAVELTEGPRLATGERMTAEEHLTRIELIGNAHVHWRSLAQ